VALEFEEAITKIEAALKSEGFGILCQIDIQAEALRPLPLLTPDYRDIAEASSTKISD
jgi:uncharacterized protein (DUF302 family)